MSIKEFYTEQLQDAERQIERYTALMSSIDPSSTVYIYFFNCRADYHKIVRKVNEYLNR